MFYNGFKRKKGIWLFVFSLLPNFASAQKGDSLYTLKANIDFNLATGGAKDIELEKNLMYVLSDGGVRVYDISDVSHPSFLSGLDLKADDIEVRNSILYASHYVSGELVAVDYSDPTHPLLYDPVEVGGDAADVEIKGDRMYVARRFNGIGILDISTPTSPILEYEIPSHNNGYFFDIAVEGDYLYVADNRDYTESLHIYDLLQHNLISSFMHTEGSGSRIEVSGDLVFLYADLEGLQIIDISNKGRPTYKSNFDLDDCINDIEANGATAYVAYCRNGLVILDASDPLRPEMTGNLCPGWFYDVELSGNICFLANGGFGIKVVDVSTPSSTTVLEEIETYGSARSFDLRDDYAFIANERMGLYVVDISDQTNPNLLNIVEPEGAIADVEIQDNYAYVVDDEVGLMTFDISDPNAISVTGSLSLDGNPKELVVSGNRVYVADRGKEGIWIADISNPSAPQLVTHVEDVHAKNLIATGDILYYAVLGDGFNIIDFSDISHPTLLGKIDLSMLIEGGGVGLDIENNTAYVAYSDGFGSSAWLGLVDISDLTNPYIRSEMTFEVGLGSYDLNLIVEENKIFLAESEGVQIFDVTDQIQPRFTGAFHTEGIPCDLRIKDDNICIAEGSSGFSIYEPVPPPGRGDVNGDGVTNLLDVMKVIDHLLGIQILEADQFDRGDCNNDGEINVLDVFGIVNVILGIPMEIR